MIRLGRNNARIVRWICTVRLEDKVSAEKLMKRLKLISMRDNLQDRRPQSFGHLKKIKQSTWSSKCRTFKFSGSFP